MRKKRASLPQCLQSRYDDGMNTAELWFNIGNALILPFWGMLFFMPQSKATDWVFQRSKVSPLHLLALIYAITVIPALLSNPENLAALARPTLEGVKGLLGSDAGAAAGWIHYLCFDLFVGVAVWKSARDRKHGFFWVSPVLGLVLMFGPLGWLTYELISRCVQWRRV